jgi:dihydrofolate reductase
MSLAIIAAMTPDRVIGRNNQLPWHLRADLQRFKQITMGKTLLMGRKTHESIGKALPGRTNVILTQQADYQATGCEIIHQLEPLLQQQTEIMLIGGASLYAQLLSSAQKMYLTLVAADLAGDAHFPPWDHNDWQELQRSHHMADADNDFDYTFIDLVRIPRGDKA